MRPTIIIRSRLAQTGFVLVSALAVALEIQAAAVAGPMAALRLSAFPTLVIVLAYLLWWHPRVTINDRGVEIRNPLRLVALTYGELDQVSARGALRLHAGSRTFTAWAAPARGGYRASTRPAPIAPQVVEGTARMVVAADAASAARLIEQEQVHRAAGAQAPAATTDRGPHWTWQPFPAALALLAVGRMVISVL
ncbi:MAG: hypothetical protein Q4P36_04865 [Bowdeniella nasicola]|nr:hypothetical protein [Bowdeniella nasicola]